MSRWEVRASWNGLLVPQPSTYFYGDSHAKRNRLRNPPTNTNLMRLVLPSLRSSGGFKSCDTLLKRIENDDPTLETVVFLPMKSFGSDEVVRFISEIL